MMQAMAGFDPLDSTSADVPLQDLFAAVTLGVKGMRIGIFPEYVLDGMDPEVVTIWQQGQDWLRAAGAGTGRYFAAPHQICAARLLHRCAC